MSVPNSLKEVYLHEMQDLWSANDQMMKAVQQLSGHASDTKLKQLLEHSVAGIKQHTETLKGIIEANGGEAKPDHCKGMEGLATEALKHGIKEAPAAGKLQDISILAQYQRMSHYGIAGFGSVAAYAHALGLSDQASQLKKLVSDIYKSDEFSSHLAESLEHAAV